MQFDCGCLSVQLRSLSLSITLNVKEFALMTGNTFAEDSTVNPDHFSETDPVYDVKKLSAVSNMFIVVLSSSGPSSNLHLPKLVSSS